MNIAISEQLYTIEEVGVSQRETGAIVYHGYKRHGVPMPCFTADQIAAKVAEIMSKGGNIRFIVRPVRKDEIT